MVTAEIASDGNASFLRAARAGNLEKVLEYLKGNVDINTSNANGLNALHLASKEGHVYVVTELLKKGANVNAATKKGNTALHIASLAGQDEVVRVLVNLGANVNAQSQNGFTPLYMAAQENHDHVVSFLLSNGANQSLSTEDGFTPLAVALQQGHDRVVAVLLENDTKGKVRLPALHIAAKKNDCKAAALLLQNDHNPDVTSKSGFTPLHISAHYGNENVGNILMDKGADVNFAAKHQITPLHVASKWGKSNMVALLIAKGANIEASTRDGLTPLHCAARSGHDQVVDQLLEKGAPILAKTKNGLAPLHMASQGDHVDSARILLYHKAPVDDVTVDYLTALHVAAHCGHVKVAKLLLDRKADPNARALNGFTPLHIACKKNRIKVVELLLKHGASIEATTESGLTPLHVASFMGCMNIVIYLIQNGANPDVPTVRGETPLHLAARANQTDIIRILLRNGASVDARAREDQTPLHIASRLGNVDIVSLLLQHGAAVDATTKDMYTALHIAAKEDQEEVSSVLLDHGASLVSTTKKGFTPLHLAAKYGNIKVARLLLQKDAPVDAQGKNGVTPLHVAAHYDHVNVALLLLDKGASPHAKAKNGYTPLHIAAKKNQMDIATTLLEYGAESNTESKAGFTPLHLASQEGHTDIASLLIEHSGDVNHKANNGLTPLHLCAQNDRVNVATILVENGAEIAPQTKAGYTPLHVASHFGQINMVKYLLQQNANVNITTMHGYTPLHQAAQQGHTLAVNLLLENNASPNVLTSQGQTPLSIAQRLGYISVVETLKVVTETTVTTTTTTVTEEKYKVVAPETMQETFMTDSEDEGGGDFEDVALFGKPTHATHVYLPYVEGQKILMREDTMLGDQSYRYLTADEMKSLGDDSLPMDVTKDERQYDTMHLVKESAAPVVEEDNLSPQHITPVEVGFSEKYSPDNIDISHAPLHTGRLKWKTFLVSFMVDARGGAMRGCRHSGVRVIIPPRKASMPMRITCRYLRKEKLIHPPPLMEGEACASRILEVGPVGARFLGPVIIEVPHFASLRGKEREIIILRSDAGETWREHTFEASDEAIRDVLNESFEGEEFSALEDLNTSRITRILTTDFPQYFAIITRIRQEVHSVGPEGGIVSSTVVPQVQTIFPDGALTKKIRVGLQAQPIAPELVAKLLGNRVAVSPVVTVEPRRRKFHKPITLTIPVPQAATKGMINQYSGDAPTLRLLCSITGSTKSGGSSKAQWEDVTGSTPLTFVNDCVSFTTTVSARFWLMDCRQISEASKFATELYQEAVHVPFMSKFVVFAKRSDPNEAHLRVFCMTDDKEDKTLEMQEHFTEIAKSRDVEVLEGKLQFLEFAGNLVPVTKSGEQLQLSFQAFHENRIPFIIRVKDPHMEPMGRIAFMKEPKVGRGEPPQVPICNLNVALPEVLVVETPVGLELVTLEKKDDFVHESGLSKPEAIHRADLRLSDIARELDKDWLNLAHQLEVSEADINSAKYECLEDPCEQALIMLRIWLQKAGSKGTGNELEKALRKINRDDIIQKCMINVELVTDDVEKAVAKVQLDQSGFDVFKEELGSSREASMRRGASLDISYDEQDVMKDAESAAETSSETGSIFEREQISQVFSDDKESMIRRVSKTPPPSPEVSEKSFECRETKVTEKAVEIEIPEHQEVIVKQVQTVFVKSADLVDMQEINPKMTESETWPSGEMDTSQVSVSSLPDDEKSEPTTATVSSATAAEPDAGVRSEEMREWTEVDESGTVKHIIHKTTHMTLSVQQKQDGTSDIEGGTNLPLPALETSVEPGSKEGIHSESTSPVIEQNESPESPQLSFAEKCDFFNKLSISSSSQTVTPSHTLKSTALEEVGTQYFVCEDASSLVEQLSFAERLKIFENSDVSEHPSGSVTDIKTEVWTIASDVNVAQTEVDLVSRNLREMDISDHIGSKEPPKHIPEAFEPASCETLLDTKVEVLVKQYEPGKEAIEICSVESTKDEKETIRPDKSELVFDSRIYFNRKKSEKADLKKLAETYNDSENFSCEELVDASVVEPRLLDVTPIIHTASQSDISSTNRLAKKTTGKEPLAFKTSEFHSGECEIELLTKTIPLQEIPGIVEKYDQLSSYTKNQVPADDTLFPSLLTTMNIPHVTDLESKQDGSASDKKLELKVTTLSHEGTNVLKDTSSDTIATKVVCSLSEILESNGSLGDRMIKDLENEIKQPEAQDKLYCETFEVSKVLDVAFADTKDDYDNETVSTNGITGDTVKVENAVDVKTGEIFESRPSSGLEVKTFIPTEATPEIEDCIIDELVDEIKSSKYTSSEIVSVLSKEPKHGVNTDEITEPICTMLKLSLDEKALNNNSESHLPPKTVTQCLSPEKQAPDDYNKDELHLHLSKEETINLDIVENKNLEISEGLLEKFVTSGEERSPDILDDGSASSAASLTLETVKVFAYREGNVNVIGMDNGSCDLSEERLECTVEDDSKIYPMQKKNVQDAAESECEESGNDFQKLSSFGKINELSESSFVTDIKVGINKSFNVDFVEYYPGNEVDDKVESMIQNLRTSVETEQAKFVDTVSEEVTEKNRQAFKLDHSNKIEKPENQYEQSSSSGEIFICTEQTLDNVKMILSAAEAESSIVLPNIDVHSCNEMETDSKSCETTEIPETLHKSCEDIDKLEEEISDASELKYQEEEKELHESLEEIVGMSDFSKLKYQKEEKDHLESPDKVNDIADITESKYREELKELSKSSESIDGKSEFSVSTSFADRSFEVNNVEIVPVLEVSEEVSKVSVDMTGHEALGTSCSFHKEMTIEDHILRAPGSVVSDNIKLKPEIFCDLVEKADFEEVEKKTLNDTANKIELAEAVFQRIYTDENRKKKETWESVEIIHHKDLSKEIHSIPSSKVTSKISCKERQYEKDSRDYPATLHKLDDFLKSVTQVDANNEEPSFSSNVEAIGTRTEEWVNRSGEDLLKDGSVKDYHLEAIENGLCEEQAHTLDEEFQKRSSPTAESFDDEARVERCDTDIMMQLLDYVSRSDIELAEVRTEDEAPDIEEDVSPSAEEENPNKTLHEDPKFADRKMDKSVPETILCTQTPLMSKDSLMNEPDDENLLLSPLKSSFDSVTSPSRKDADVTAREIKTLEEEEEERKAESETKENDVDSPLIDCEKQPLTTQGKGHSDSRVVKASEDRILSFERADIVHIDTSEHVQHDMKMPGKQSVGSEDKLFHHLPKSSLSTAFSEEVVPNLHASEENGIHQSSILFSKEASTMNFQDTSNFNEMHEADLFTSAFIAMDLAPKEVDAINTEVKPASKTVQIDSSEKFVALGFVNTGFVGAELIDASEESVEFRSRSPYEVLRDDQGIVMSELCGIKLEKPAEDADSVNTDTFRKNFLKKHDYASFCSENIVNSSKTSASGESSFSSGDRHVSENTRREVRRRPILQHIPSEISEEDLVEKEIISPVLKEELFASGFLCNDFFDGSKFETSSTGTFANINEFGVEDFGTKLSSDVTLEIKHSDTQPKASESKELKNDIAAVSASESLISQINGSREVDYKPEYDECKSSTLPSERFDDPITLAIQTNEMRSLSNVDVIEPKEIVIASSTEVIEKGSNTFCEISAKEIDLQTIHVLEELPILSQDLVGDIESTRLVCFNSISDDIVDAEIGNILRSEVQVEDDIIERPLTPEPPEQFHMLETGIGSLSCLGEASAFCEEFADVKVMSQTFKEEIEPSVECSDFQLKSNLPEKFLKTQLQEGLIENKMIGASASKMLDDFPETYHDFTDSMSHDLDKKETVGLSQHHTFQEDSDNQTKLSSWPVGSSTEILALTDFSSTKPDVIVHGESSNFPYGMQFEKDVDEHVEEAMDIDSDQCSEEKDHSYNYGMRFEREQDLDDDDDDDIPGYGDLYTHQEEDEDIIDESEKEKLPYLSPKADKYIKPNTQEFDTLAGRKFFCRNGDLDDLSLSSLQEFERLEEEIVSGRKSSIGSVDSFNGKPIHSKSGEHDDVSMNSLTEFEKLERECAEAERAEAVSFDVDAHLSEIEEGHESQASETSQETMLDIEKDDDLNEPIDYDDSLVIDKVIQKAQSSVENLNEISSAKYFVPAAHHSDDKADTISDDSMSASATVMTVKKVESPFTVFTETNVESAVKTVTEATQVQKNSVTFTEKKQVIRSPCLSFERPLCIIDHKNHDTRDFKMHIFEHTKRDDVDVDQDSLHDDQSFKPDSLSGEERHDYQDSLLEDKSGEYDSLQDEMHEEMKDSLHEERQIDEDSLHEMEMPLDESSLSLESSASAMIAFPCDSSRIDLSETSLGQFVAIKRITNSDIPKSLNLGLTLESVSASHVHDISVSDTDQGGGGDVMISSIDSLDHSSSAATHATYQFETESVMSSSINSVPTSDDFTMISSTDALEPDIKISSSFSNFSVTEMEALGKSGQRRIFLDSEGNIQETDTIYADSEGNLQTILSHDTLGDEAKLSYPLPTIHTYGTTGSSRIGMNYTKPSIQQHPHKLKSDGLYLHSEETSVQRSSSPEVEGISIIDEKSEHKVVCKIKQTPHRIPDTSGTESTSESMDEKFREFLRTRVLDPQQRKCEEELQQEKIIDEKGNVVIVNTVKRQFVSRPEVHSETFTGSEAEKFSNEFIQSFKVEATEKHDHFEKVDAEGNLIRVTQHTILKPTMHAVSFSGPEAHKQMEEYMKHWSEHETGDKTSVDISDIIENSESFQASTSFQSQPSTAGRSSLTDLTRNYEGLSEQSQVRTTTTMAMYPASSDIAEIIPSDSTLEVQSLEQCVSSSRDQVSNDNNLVELSQDNEEDYIYKNRSSHPPHSDIQ